MSYHYNENHQLTGGLLLQNGLDCNTQVAGTFLNQSKVGGGGWRRMPLLNDPNYIYIYLKIYICFRGIYICTYRHTCTDILNHLENFDDTTRLALTHPPTTDDSASKKIIRYGFGPWFRCCCRLTHSLTPSGGRARSAAAARRAAAAAAAPQQVVATIAAATRPMR